LFGCSSDDELNISLALQEALANAVVHGCQKNPSQMASCSVECDPSGSC
jgi:anti-sigma regulatory factor (Ser/Thr protein kinase)